MVNVGTGTSGTRFVKRNWPNQSGLEAGTKKQEGRQSHLIVQEDDLTDINTRVGL